MNRYIKSMNLKEQCVPRGPLPVFKTEYIGIMKKINDRNSSMVAYYLI